MKGRIFSLEQQNEKLTVDLFSATKERIASLEVELERLNGLLLRRLTTPNESPGAAAVGGSNGNGQPMTGKIESSGGDEPSYMSLTGHQCIGINSARFSKAICTLASGDAGGIIKL